MADVVNDKITEARKTTNPVVTTVATARSIDGTSLICTSLSGWPTNTAVHFITYKKTTAGAIDKTTQCDWKGIVSSNTIGTLTLKSGTDAGNDVGDFVEMGPTAAYAEDLAEALENEHNTDGTHSDITANSIDISSSITLPNGSIATAAIADAAITVAKRAGGFKIGSITPSGTGNLATTGVGFIPKAVFFFVLPSSNSGHNSYGYGGMTASNQFYSAGDNTTSAAARNSDNSHCHGVIGSTSATPSQLATFVSMDSDGFTINFSVQSAAPFAYIALG